MKEYNVRVPMCGYVEFTVEAESESEASELGLRGALELRVDTSDELLDQGNVKFEDSAVEFLAKTGEGNVTYLECNEIEVEEL